MLKENGMGIQVLGKQKLVKLTSQMKTCQVSLNDNLHVSEGIFDEDKNIFSRLILG